MGGFGKALIGGIGQSNLAQSIAAGQQMAINMDEYQRRKRADAVAEQKRLEQEKNDNRFRPLTELLAPLEGDEAKNLATDFFKNSGRLVNVGGIEGVIEKDAKSLGEEYVKNESLRTSFNTSALNSLFKKKTDLAAQVNELMTKKPDSKDLPILQQQLKEISEKFQSVADQMHLQEKMKLQKLSANEALVDPTRPQGQNVVATNPVARQDTSLSQIDLLRSKAGRLIQEGKLKPEAMEDWVLKENSKYEGMKTGERNNATFESRSKNADIIFNEVRKREQAKLDVKFDPKNMEKETKLIEKEAIARGKGQPLPAETQQVLQQAETILTATNELKERFTPAQRQDFVGYIKNPSNRALQYVKGDPDFAEFQAIMGRIKASAFGEAGKNFTATEMKYVTQYIPQGDEPSFQDFEKKLIYADRAARFIIESRSRLATMTRGDLKGGLPEPKYPAEGGNKKELLKQKYGLE